MTAGFRYALIVYMNNAQMDSAKALLANLASLRDGKITVDDARKANREIRDGMSDEEWEKAKLNACGTMTR